MAATNFPDTPTLNQQFAGANGVNYTWDGAVWTLGSLASGYPPSGAAGGDLTGTYPNPTLATQTSLTARALTLSTQLQSIPNNTATVVVFQSGVGANSGITVGTDRLTIITPGWYIFGGNVCYDNVATGTRRGQLNLNGGLFAIHEQTAGTASDYIRVAIAGAYYLVANDYIQLVTYQTSGAAANIGNTVRSLLWALRIL